MLPRSGAAAQWVPSPDGRNIAMVVAEPSGTTAVWVRALGDTATHRLEKTEGAELPFWPPDGKSLAFFTDNRLNRIELTGGGFQTVCNLPVANAVSPGDGGAWSRDGVIVFSLGEGNGLFRVPAAGGSAHPATALPEGETRHSWPQFLPDGRHLLYHAQGRQAADSAVYVQELGSAKRVQAMKSETRAVWSPPGYLLFTRESTLYARPMSLSSFHLEGQPAALQEDVLNNITNGRGTIAASQNGVLVYRIGQRLGERQLSWRDREGKVVAEIGRPGQFYSFSLSPR
jgi:hypothetical protein